MTARNLLVVLLAAAALFVAGAIVAAMGVEGYRLWSVEAADETAPAAPAVAEKEVAPLAPIATADVVAPKLDAPSPFVWLPFAKPKAFCNSLGGAGFRNTDFQTAQWPAKGWTCVADLMKPVSGDDADVSSLFVSARGLDSETLETFRVKLNLLDPGTAPVVVNLAQDVVDRVFLALGFEPPDEALAALKDLKEGVITIRGVTFDLRKEFSGNRYNLVVTFPQRLGTGGFDRFIPPPRGGYARG